MSGEGTARARFLERLHTTTVVVGGPGTGKTAAVVERAAELVRTGAAGLRDLTVLTRSQAAAADLRCRLRDHLESGAYTSHTEPAVSGASGEVGDAVICTPDAFAHRILLEHCEAAGLPPGFEVLDDAAEARELASRWDRFVDALFDDAFAARALARGFASGLRHTDLFAVARALHDDWERLEDRTPGIGDTGGEGTGWPDADPGPVVAALDRALALAGCCTVDEDNLLGHLRAVAADARAQLQAAAGDEEAVLQVLTHLRPLRSTLGRREHWAGRVGEVRDACAEADRTANDLLDAVRREALGTLLPRLVAFVLDAAEERRVEGRLTLHDLLVHARLLVRSGGEPLAALRRRYRWILVDEFEDGDPIQVELAGRLAAAAGSTFEPAATRPGALFVAGDPAQSIYRLRPEELEGLEVLERVGSAAPERVLLGASLRAVPGIVDFVDVVSAELFGAEPVPGQAAHRPLRADRPSLETEGSSPTCGAEQAELPWDDSGSPDGAGPSRDRGPSRDAGPSRDTERSRARPPTSASRRVKRAGSRAAPGAAAAGAGAAGAPVVVLGGSTEGSLADVLRQSARDATRAVRRVVAGGWLVEDEDRTRRRRRRARPARFGDVAVLVADTQFLPALEEAFDEAALPCRLEGPWTRWRSSDVRDVLTVLRAADDPVDPVAVVAALRGAGLGCGDDDLVTWHSADGSWDPRSSPPDGLDGHPVAQAMRTLDELHHARWWEEPSTLVARACEVLRQFDLAFAHRRPREHWRRLCWLYDQARLFDETAGGTLRAFLAWADLRAAGDGDGAGAGPADPDEDAVRVMTARDAKGLEFPVVVLCGLERRESGGRRSPPVLWGPDGTVEARAGALFRTGGYDEVEARDRELDALERTRLLYVAMTRARDHLVLCLHHRARSGAADSSLAPRLFDLCARRPDLWRPLPDEAPAAPRAFTGTGDTGVLHEATSPGEGDAPPDAGAGDDAAQWRRFREQWRETRSALLERLRTPPVVPIVVPATSARAGTSPDGTRAQSAPLARDGDVTDAVLLPQVVGAARSALAAVDLTSGRDAAGRDVEELALAHAVARGVESHAGRVAAMMRAALESDVVRRAATRRHWRDLYVAAPFDHAAGGAAGGAPATGTERDDGATSRPGTGAEDAHVVEGCADLVFEDEDGMVVVRYTTVKDPGVAYAVALESASGFPVVRCVSLDVSRRPAVALVLEGDALTSACARTREKISPARAS